jgi:hypothetical protein
MLSMINTRTGRDIQAGVEVGRFQSIYALVLPGRDARTIGGDRSSDLCPSARRRSVQTEESGGLEHISHDGYHAAVDSRFVHGHQEKSICLWNGTRYLISVALWHFAMMLMMQVSMDSFESLIVIHGVQRIAAPPSRFET